MFKAVNADKVKLTGGIFKERQQLNRAYLLSLDTQCLLQNFYLEAGIIMPGLQVVPDPENANLHWGWESPTCQLRGHFLGHFMSAAAKLVASGQDKELATKLDIIVGELKRCQDKNGGRWVGPIPEKYMNLLAKDEYIWSPQYTMHKTLMGLVDTCKYTGNETALGIADSLADWYIDWIEKISKENPDTVYKGEQGGMLEIWAELYLIMGDKKYQKLIDAYKDNELYAQLREGRDALTDKHANASIPLSHGAAKMYELTGDEEWKEIVGDFWKNAVTGRGMYATTGSNAGEFWIPPHMHGQYIADNDQEFCTVYNMVRTADSLLCYSEDTAYADYIERALYNGFLAQQNPYTGMPAYFLPLRSGSRKKWGTRTRDFWCCYGTMVQAQTLYPELIYYTGEKEIAVMQYIPSEASLSINDTSVIISQKTEMSNYDNQVFFDDKEESSEKTRWSLKLTVKCEKENEFALMLRVPGWAKDKPKLNIDGEVIVPEIKNGYLRIDKKWKESTIYLVFKSAIVMEQLPDMPELAAAVDGPIVLAGMTDEDTGLIGDFEKPREIFAPRMEHTYSTYVWKQNNYVTRMQPKNIEFKPLYDVADEAYTVYFTKKQNV